MLHILDRDGSRDCGGTTRRDFLKISTIGLGGCAVPAWLTRHLDGAESPDFIKGKSVVLLFLCGGASHIETFDPKPDAPSDFRSVTGSIPTAIPGVRFGGTFEGLARRADRLAVVRSFAPHGISDHARAIKHVLTSGDPDGTSIGARFARLRGASHRDSGLSTYCTLIEPGESDSQYREDRDRMRVGSRPGSLGKTYAPFDPGGEGELKENMTLRLPLERLRGRRNLRHAFDRLRRDIDTTGVMTAMDRYEQQAIEVLLGGHVREALDLSREDPRIVERYDTSGFQVGWTRKRPSTLGQRLLMARRLCQAGCGFVTVGSAGWDNHANGKHPNVFDGMHLLGRPLDKAVSAFLDDVEEQGLKDEILLVITSEFGRTPRIGKNGGRDHWPGLNSLVFAGGGLNVGQVVGASTSKAEVPNTEPIGFDGLLGTIWHTLFDVGKLRIKPDLPRPIVAELERCQPIRELVS